MKDERAAFGIQYRLHISFYPASLFSRKEKPTKTEYNTSIFSNRIHLFCSLKYRHSEKSFQYSCTVAGPASDIDNGLDPYLSPA